MIVSNVIATISFTPMLRLLYLLEAPLSHKHK